MEEKWISSINTIIYIKASPGPLWNQKWGTVISPPAGPVVIRNTCSSSGSVMKNSWWLLLPWMPLQVKGEVKKKNELKKKSQSQRILRRLSGRKHNLVWGNITARGQESEVFFYFSSELVWLVPTWVYLKSGRGSNSAVKCFLQQLPATAACCVCWHNSFEQIDVKYN